MTAQLYSNENFPLLVVTALRELGHDVLTSKDADKAHEDIPDEEVLRFATVSFGETRTFRFSRRGGDSQLDKRDYKVMDGSVLVMSWDVNQHWKHEVPHHKCNESRRISVTLEHLPPICHRRQLVKCTATDKQMDSKMNHYCFAGGEGAGVAGFCGCVGWFSNGSSKSL